VPNPAGRGVAPQDQQPQDGSNANSQESVFVPPTQDASSSGGAAGVPGQAAPEQDNNGIEGRPNGQGQGQTTAADRGAGTRNQIRTPYKQVIGDYVKQATQALEQVYIPADTKEYVKQYFTELGK